MRGYTYPCHRVVASASALPLPVAPEQVRCCPRPAWQLVAVSLGLGAVWPQHELVCEVLFSAFRSFGLTFTFSAQCRFGATRVPPEDSFLRSWIDYALATMLENMPVEDSR